MNVPAMNVVSEVPAPARDLVVAFLIDHPKAALLLWAARKRAQEVHGRWCVVYVETPNEHKQAGHHEQILSLMTRAKQMGAEVEHIQALNPQKGAEEFLVREASRIAIVIIGSVECENEILDRLRTPQWVKLVQIASQYANVESVPLAGQFQQPLYRYFFNRLIAIEPKHILYGLVCMIIPYCLTSLLQLTLPPIFFRINQQNIDNLFLITAAIVAGRFGLVPGVISAIAGFFINNYYFTLPYHQVKLNAATDVFGMVLFLTAAILMSIFTSRMREYTHKIRKRELHSEILFTLYRLASESFSRQQAIETLQQNLERMLNAKVAFFMPGLTSHTLEVVAPTALELSDMDKKALDACWSDMKCTGAASPFNPGTEWRFEPMVAASEEVGVLGVKVHNAKQLDAWFGRLLTATADQTATILSHIELEKSMEATRISQEREKLRVMLLSSVSHDLKTPLAGIIGALSACQTLGGRLTPAQQKELIAGSLEEAQRLDSFITNILDMTRLETGNVKFRMGWHNVKDVTENVTKRLAHRFKQRTLSLQFPEQDIEAYMDDIMIGQVLQNLLDNACKYTPADSSIIIRWEPSDNGIICSVHDHGPGIPTEKLLNVFDKYTRLQKQDMQTPGTGLGLAISRAILEAQGGWIKADNHSDGGAVFSFLLPQWRYAAAQLQEEKLYANVK